MAMYLHNKRNAFTMVELIFVIVIIGILAAVAIPKLAATRDDAKIASIARDIGIASGDIAAYVLANGSSSSDLSIMSFAVDILIKSAEAVSSPYQLSIKAGNVNDCITLRIDTNSTIGETLLVEYGSSTDRECNSLQSIINDNAYSIPLRGNLII